MTDVKTPFMRVFASLFILLSVSISSHSAHAGTTTADFLKWERKSQDYFLQVSLDMIGTIAPQINANMAICLKDWYFNDKKLHAKRHDEILKIMFEYREFHPSAVILAYVEGVCGRVSRN